MEKEIENKNPNNFSSYLCVADVELASNQSSMKELIKLMKRTLSQKEIQEYLQLKKREKFRTSMFD